MRRSLTYGHLPRPPVPGIASGLARREEVVSSQDKISLYDDVGPCPILQLNDATYDPKYDLFDLAPRNREPRTVPSRFVCQIN